MVTVKDFYDQNESIRDEVTIVIQEDLPFPDTLWEGLLSEVPEKFYDCEVVQTGKSLQALQEGYTKYYFSISEAPKEDPVSEKPGCYYRLRIWEPESEDEIPVMYNIGSWLTMQDAMLEEFAGYSIGYKVELRLDWISIFNPESEPLGFHLNLTEPFMWEYVNNGVIRLNSVFEILFEKDAESKQIKFLHTRNINSFVPPECEPGLPFSEEVE